MPLDAVGPVKPISPSEVVPLQKQLLPDWVLTTWNNLIAKNWNGDSSTVLQKDVINALIMAGPDEPSVTRQDISDNKWLEIESIYRAEGWEVRYDKPAYNENYDAYFKFTPKKVRLGPVL